MKIIGETPIKTFKINKPIILKNLLTNEVSGLNVVCPNGVTSLSEFIVFAIIVVNVKLTVNLNNVNNVPTANKITYILAGILSSILR